LRREEIQIFGLPVAQVETDKGSTAGQEETVLAPEEGREHLLLETIE